jgi:hypothetical protein
VTPSRVSIPAWDHPYELKLSIKTASSRCMGAMTPLKMPTGNPNPTSATQQHQANPQNS